MVKFLVTYKDGEQFGIEIETELALKLLTAWLNKSKEEYDVDGYGFYPADAVRVELFDFK